MDNSHFRILNFLRRWRFNYISRRQLLALDHQSLKDIGISRSDALEEGRKPFWKGGVAAVQRSGISRPDSRDIIAEPRHKAQY